MGSVEEVKDILRELGMEKVYEIDRWMDCTLYITSFRGMEFIVAVTKGRNTLYAKIIPAHQIPTSYWSCRYVDYVPSGLYAFGKDVSELCRNIVNKAELLAKATGAEGMKS